LRLAVQPPALRDSMASDDTITVADVCSFLEDFGDSGFTDEFVALQGNPASSMAADSYMDVGLSEDPMLAGGLGPGDHAEFGLPVPPAVVNHPTAGLLPVAAALPTTESEVMGLPSATVMPFSPGDTAPTFAAAATAAAYATGGTSSAALPVMDMLPPKEAVRQASHQCVWPGCGKGFASRWALERHVLNHQAADAEAEDADSFVERRLRERLRGVEVALERTRERLAQSKRQEEQAEQELNEARALNAAQEREMDDLSRANLGLAQQLAARSPLLAQQLAVSSAYEPLRQSVAASGSTAATCS